MTEREKNEQGFRDLMEGQRILDQIAREEDLGINGARPDEVIMEDIQKQEKKEGRGRPGIALVFLLCCFGCFILGLAMGLEKTDKFSENYGLLFDRQQETIDSLRSEILEGVKVLQRDKDLKLVFPGDLDQTSKLILMRELNELVLEDMGREEGS